MSDEDQNELKRWRELTALLPHNFEECNSPPWTQIQDRIEELGKALGEFHTLTRQQGLDVPCRHKTTAEVLRGYLEQLKADVRRLAKEAEAVPQLRRIDQVARQVYDQLEVSIEKGADCPCGLAPIVWEEFGRALFDPESPVANPRKEALGRFKGKGSISPNFDEPMKLVPEKCCEHNDLEIVQQVPEYTDRLVADVRCKQCGTVGSATIDPEDALWDVDPKA